MTSGFSIRTLLRLAIATGALLSVSPVQAQIVSGTATSVSQRSLYTTWNLSNDTTDLTINQLYVPVVVKAGIAENWELSFLSAMSVSDADWDIPGDEITGLNDSRVQLAHSLADDRVLISGGVSIPTGQTELTPENRRLIPWLTADIFNFPVKYPGEGLNAFGELALATPAGEWVVGVAGAVHYAGEFTPFNDGRQYQPGTRFVGTLGAQRDGPQGSVMADVIVVYSTEDKADGRAVFVDGLQIDLRLSARRQFENGRIEAAGRAIIRGKNKMIGENNFDLVAEQNNTNGNDLRAYLSGYRRLGGRLQGWMSFEAKILAANEYEQGDELFEDAARAVGFGGGLDFQFNERATFGVGARFWSGSSDGSAAFGPLDLSGTEIIQRLTITL